MHCGLAVLLLSACLGGVLGGNADARARSTHLTRSHGFLRGEVLSSRQLASLTTASTRARQLFALHSESSSSTEPSVWVLGVPVQEQRAVHAAIIAQGGQVLYPLPGAHLLLRASTAGIQAILDEFTDVTAAAYPDSFKLSPTIDVIASVYTSLEPGKEVLTADDLPVTLRPFVRGIEGGKLLAVLLAMAPKTKTDTLAKLAREVPDRAAGAISAGCPVKATVASRGLLAVVVCMQDVPAVSQALSSLHHVSWVDLELPRTLFDVRSAATVQAPERTVAPYPAPDVIGGLDTSSSAPYCRLWAAGLDGSNQIVGVVDSGLDMDSCYTRDPNFVDHQSLYI